MYLSNSVNIQTNVKNASVTNLINYYPNCDGNIWLRSCVSNIKKPIQGKIIGTIPTWLKGTLIRNGPGRITVGPDRFNHIFDGSALLHRFHISNGKVTYKNRFLNSNSYCRDSRAGRIVTNYFATEGHPDPCRTIFQNIASIFSFEEYFSDNAQISVYPFKDCAYALAETPYAFRVNCKTLKTEEKENIRSCLPVLSQTAHPHVEENGDVYNICQGINVLGSEYHICYFPKDNPFTDSKIITSLKAQWRLNPSYMHSFSITKNYFLIIEQPLTISLKAAVKGIIQKKPLIETLRWWEEKTKFHVVNRSTGKVNKVYYEAETFFFLHTINAYEENDNLIVDIVAYKNADVINCMYVEALENLSYNLNYSRIFYARTKRWVLPLNPRINASNRENLIDGIITSCTAAWKSNSVIQVNSELLANIGCEVPRINYENYNGKKYQYFYAICSDVDHKPYPGAVDVVNKKHKEWSSENMYPSEPIFVSKPNFKNEDDGIVISTLLRGRNLENQICLLILDAESFNEIARVEFVTSGSVPKCLHGWFFPEKTNQYRKARKTIKKNA